MWSPSPGSVYPALRRLEDEGLVPGLEAAGRRVFELTDVGRIEAERRKGDPYPWATDEGDDLVALLRDRAYGMIVAAMQVAQIGTPEELARAKEILANIRKRLYRLLAGDESAGESPIEYQPRSPPGSG